MLQPNASFGVFIPRMVPSGVVAPRCRPKRAAASKAEGVISEALSGSVDKTDERRAQQADAESDKNAPVETSRPVGWLQQRPAHDVKRVNKGKAKKTSKSRSSQMVCTTPLAKVDTKLEFSSYSGSRRSHESKAGTKRGRESADHNPLASSRGRPTDQLRVKPKPPQGVGGVSCLMKSFAAHGGPRFEIPINPTMQDAWKVLDIVLAYLPSTTVLNVDTLLHLAGAIPRKEGESSAEASSDAGGSAAPDAAPDQSVSWSLVGAVTCDTRNTFFGRTFSTLIDMASDQNSRPVDEGYLHKGRGFVDALASCLLICAPCSKWLEAASRT